MQSIALSFFNLQISKSKNESRIFYLKIETASTIPAVFILCECRVMLTD